MDFKNKLFMFLLIVSFISMSSVSAFEFDNVKAYDPISREVTITNAFGLGDEIGKARLNTPLNVKVGAGYQKVAEFDLWAYEDYSDALKQFSFKDMNKGKEKINRDYDLKYLTYEEVKVNDYKQVCEVDIKSINKTEICNNVIIGDHLETREVWNKITPADLKKNEKLTIGIFTEVKMGDYIDWIPTIYGVEVEQWATWEADLKTDLVSYYKLDETSGTTADDAHGSNDGTNSGATVNVAGKIGKAYDFDGTSDYVTLPQILNSPSEFSVQMWIKSDVVNTVEQRYIAYNNDGVYFTISLNGGTNNLIRGYCEGASGGSWTDSTTAYTVTGWHHIILTAKENDVVSLYVDGSLIGTATAITTFEDLGSELARNIGKGRISDSWANGLADEVGIWSRVLSSEEIEFLYNHGTGLTYEDDAFIANSPTIILNSPSSANYTTTQSLTINFSASDDINLQDVKLYINDVLNQTNASGINNSNYIFDLSLSDGSYTIYGIATDNESQTTNSSEIFIFIDTIEPVINITSPEDFVLGAAGDILVLNWTVTDTNLNSCWYFYNGTNTSVSCGDNTTNLSFISKEDNNITFYANDTLGNEASGFYSWGSYLSVNELSYDTLIYETGNTTIGLNLSYDISDLAVTGLIEYNGVNYSTVKAVETGGAYFSKTFNIGVGRVGEANNFTFHFIITDGYNGTTSTEEYNQTITETYLGYCNATYSTTALNFTFWDEDAGTVINASANPTTFEGSFVYWIGDGSYTKNFSISDFNQTNSSYPICISPNNSIKTNLALSYGATGYNSNSYHLSGASLTNSSSETKLWLLPNTIGSKFFISSFYGISSLNGATITATKYFSGEGVYKTTGIALTDSSGKFSMYLDQDKSYRFYAVSDGESLGYVEKGAFCETAPCEMSLQFFAESSDLLDGYNDLYAGDVVYQLYFNSTTDLANAVFSDTTGTANYFRFEVARVSLNNTDLVICDQTLYTTSGAMFCNMSGLTGNYQATLLVSRSPEKVIDIIQFIVGGLQDALGTTGLIVALFFLIIIVFSGLRNPVIAVALVPIALVCLKLIDILPISWLWISSITVLAIILIGRLKT